MKRLLLTSSFLLIFSSQLYAQQAHPCDAADTNSARVAAGTPLKVQFCQPANENITGINVHNGATTTPATNLTQLTANANGQGKVQFEASIGSFAVGTYSLQFGSVSIDAVTTTPVEGALSPPFSLIVVTASVPPTAPAIKRVSP